MLCFRKALNLKVNKIRFKNNLNYFVFYTWSRGKINFFSCRPQSLLITNPLAGKPHTFTQLNPISKPTTESGQKITTSPTWSKGIQQPFAIVCVRSRNQVPQPINILHAPAADKNTFVVVQFVIFLSPRVMLYLAVSSTSLDCWARNKTLFSIDKGDQLTRHDPGVYSPTST